MQIDQMRTHLTTLKLYMKKMEEFIGQAGSMIYEIEERLMDVEDELYYQKYENKGNIQNLNEAATHFFSPARLMLNRCCKEDINVAAFIQEFSKFNISKSKRS